MKNWKKYRLLLLAEIFVCCVLLFFCFQKEQAVCSVSGVGLGEGASIGNGMEYRITGLELMPGVYQVRLYCDAEKNQGMYAEVYADAAYHNSLLANSVTVFAGTGDFDFEIYVTDKIADAGIRLEIYGDNDPSAALELLEVYRTPMGYRMLLFLALLGCACLDALILWREGIRAGRVTIDQQLVVWGLIGVTVLSSLPSLTRYFIVGDDFFFHLLRIESLKESLLNGSTLPVRIQNYWLYGHGYAVSYFYCDLSVLLPALLRMIGFPITFSWHFFQVVIAAATYLSFYGSCVRCLTNRKAAVFGAVLYSLAPYHLLDLYKRSALGESLAMVFLPLVAAGFYLLLTQDETKKEYRTYKWYLIVGISAVLYCHIISTEFVLLTLVVCGVVFWKKAFRRKTIVQLVQGAGLTLSLTCWFWVPMLYMLGADRYVLNESISENIQESGVSLPQYLQLLPNAGYYMTELQNGGTLGFGAAVLMILVLMVLFHWIRKEKWTGSEKILTGFLAVILVISSVYFPWDALHEVPILGALSTSWQFPFRWLMAAALIAAFLGAVVYQEWSLAGGVWLHIVPGLVMALAVGTALYQTGETLQTSEPLYLYVMENMGSYMVGSGEYLPEGVTDEEYSQHLPVAEDGLTYADYEKKGQQIEMTVSNPTDQELSLELPLTGYKGYAVEDTDDGDTSEVEIAEERGAHGDLKLTIPAGYEGTIHVWYRGFALFRIAEAVSALTVVGIVLTEGIQWKKKRGNGIKEPAAV